MEKNEQTELIFSRIISKLGGLSLSQLEKECGLGNGTIGKWIKQEPSVLKLLKVAERLGVSLDYLVGREEGSRTEQKILHNEGTIDLSKNSVKVKGKKNKTICGNKGNVDNCQNDTEIDFDIAKNAKREIKMQHLQKDIEGLGVVDFEVNKQCPICHYGIEPNYLKLLPAKKEPNCKDYIGIFTCTHCSNVFTVMYKNLHNKFANFFQAEISEPQITAARSYSPFKPPIDELDKVFDIPEFEKFRKTYKELQWAIGFELGDLVGVAYRKAIEFLVYDWLLYSTGQKVEELEKMGLEKLITENFKSGDCDIADFGQKATWLGNDFTHYVNRHPEYDVADLAELFSYFLSGIQRKLAHQKANTIKNEKHKN